MYAQDLVETTARTVDTSRGSYSTVLNKEWRNRPDDERFLSLSELYGHLWDRSVASEEKTINLRSLGVQEDTGTPAFSIGGRKLGTTHWAFGQICNEIGAPAPYLRGLPTDLAMENLRHCLDRRASNVKAYADDTTIRAVTSPTYGRIHDYAIVGAIQRMVEASDVDWKIPGTMNWSTGCYDPNVEVTKATTTLFASDRDVAMFLCDDADPIEVGALDNGDPDLMFRGFFVKNSEVGDGSLYVATMYLRGVCANRCLWGVEGFRDVRIRHTRNAPARMVGQVGPVLDSYRRRADPARVVAGVKTAKELTVIETPPWQDQDEAREQQLSFLIKTMKFPKATAEAILQHDAPGTDKERLTSVWDFTSQVTSYAQTAKHHNRRLEIEGKASALLERATASV
jgi:hypothetical protein